MIRYTSSSSFILTMKGANATSNLGDKLSGGGTIIVTFDLKGEFKIKFHFLISGNWSMRRRIVLDVAVAVMSSILPPIPLSSPVARAIAGLNAALSLFFKPQLATFQMSILRLEKEMFNV